MKITKSQQKSPNGNVLNGEQYGELIVACEEDTNGKS